MCLSECMRRPETTASRQGWTGLPRVLLHRNERPVPRSSNRYSRSTPSKKLNYWASVAIESPLLNLGTVN